MKAKIYISYIASPNPKTLNFPSLINILFFPPYEMRTCNNNQPTNPSPFKTRLTIRFLQAMKNLNKNSPPSQSMADKRKRYHNIKAAAYSSMAFSVGPKRAWARALLSKIRNRSLRRYLRNRSRTNVSDGVRTTRRNPKKGRFGIRQEDDLRRLVPGGEGMEFCRLLKETAHYMMCLKAQIQVMETIVDRCLIQD